jgi:hypothetical protein
MAQQVRMGGQPDPAASRAKARLAWLGLTGVPRSVRNTRSRWTGRGGWPGALWVPESRSWVLSCGFVDEAIGRR